MFASLLERSDADAAKALLKKSRRSWTLGHSKHFGSGWCLLPVLGRFAQGLGHRRVYGLIGPLGCARCGTQAGATRRASPWRVHVETIYGRKRSETNAPLISQT